MKVVEKDRINSGMFRDEYQRFGEAASAPEDVGEYMKSEPDEFIRILRNEDITEIVAEIPDGHRHLRTRVTFADGTAITFQEATMAALVRAYVAVKTDPRRKRLTFKGQRLAERKEGYAEWQLLEEP